MIQALEKLLRVTDKAEQLREVLRVYGTHRWSCAIQVRIRKGGAGPTPACNCGWSELDQLLVRKTR